MTRIANALVPMSRLLLLATFIFGVYLLAQGIGAKGALGLTMMLLALSVTIRRN